MPSSFDYTVEIERALLKVITGNQMLTRLYMSHLKDVWFTSKERKFIFAIADKVFQTSKTHLTRVVLEYEINSQVPDQERAFYLGEWNLVENFITGETPEILISKLKDAQLGRETLAMNGAILNLLNKGDIKGAVKVAKQSSLRLGIEHDPEPIVELTDYERRKNLILDKKAHPELYAALLTGFPEFDNRTGGLFKGELTLVAGLTGVGKSTFCKQLGLNVIRLNHGKNVLHIANEEYMEQVEHKYDAAASLIPYRDFKRATISDNDMLSWEAEMQQWKKYGRLFIKSIPAFSDVTLIEQAFEELNSKGIKIDLIIIDHLPHIMPIITTWNENDERAKAAADCKELARSLKIPVVTPTQAATIVEEKQAKGKATGKMDVYGSKGQVHIANTFMLVTDIGKDPNQTCDEFDKDVFWKVDIKKNRDGPPFFFTVKHYVHVGRIEEVHILDKAGKMIPTQPGSQPAKTPDEHLKEALEMPSAKQQASNKAIMAPNSPVKPSAPPVVVEMPSPHTDALQDKGDAYEGDITTEMPSDLAFGSEVPPKEETKSEIVPPKEVLQPNGTENLSLREKMRKRLAEKAYNLDGGTIINNEK